jgi:hypothetical protein
MNVSTKSISALIQNVKRASKFKLLSISFLSLFLMLFLSFCSKNMAEMPGGHNIEVSALKQTSPSRMNNSQVAVPFEETLFVPCGNGGAGENVALTGAINFVYQMSWTDHGFNLVYHTNSHGITGVGLSSNEIFLGSLGTNGSVMGSWVNNQWIGTTIERMRIIGQHTAYVVRYKYQLIVTPDGKVTVSTREKTIDCLDK